MKNINLMWIACLFISTPSTASAPDTLWTRTYGGSAPDAGYSVQQTSDGGFIIAGCTYSFGEGDDDIYLVRTDSLGDTLWTRVYGGTSDDAGFSVRQTSDDGFIIVGGTVSFGAGDVDVYLIRTDANGTPLWTKTFGGTDFDNGWSVKQTTDGGFILVGGTISFGAGDSGYADVYLIRTDSLGDSMWTKTFGGNNVD